MLWGELAALATAVCWAITSIVFAEAARRVGFLRVNLLRLPVGLLFLSIPLVVGRGSVGQVGSTAFAYLSASAVIGLVAGDLAFFASLEKLGARLASLLMALAPIFASVTGAALLGEVPGAWGVGGIILTMAGVAWVVAERRPGQARGRREPRGVILGVVGAMCQGVGLVLAKLGMVEGVTPLAATWIRIAVATAGIWLLTAALGKAAGLAPFSTFSRAGWWIVAGAFFGPFVGVWLSLVAARLTDVGVAATIMTTTPILLIPVVMVTESYRPTVRAVVGTVVAVFGVTLLFSR